MTMQQQRRGRRIAMSEEELDHYLTEQRTARVATVLADGAPHVAPLWFVWHGGHVWLYSLTRSQRWKNLMRDPRVALVIDDGDEYVQLRGVEIHGTAEPVGEQPRTGTPHAELEALERILSTKYHGGMDPFPHDGRHAWLRITPHKIVSWDFTKAYPQP